MFGYIYNILFTGALSSAGKAAGTWCWSDTSIYCRA